MLSETYSCYTFAGPGIDLHYLTYPYLQLALNLAILCCYYFNGFFFFLKLTHTKIPCFTLTTFKSQNPFLCFCVTGWSFSNHWHFSLHLDHFVALKYRRASDLFSPLTHGWRLWGQQRKLCWQLNTGPSVRLGIDSMHRMNLLKSRRIAFMKIQHLQQYFALASTKKYIHVERHNVQWSGK